MYTLVMLAAATAGPQLPDCCFRKHHAPAYYAPAPCCEGGAEGVPPPDTTAPVEETPEMAKKRAEFEAFVNKNVPDPAKKKEFIEYYKSAPAKDRADFFKEVMEAYGSTETPEEAKKREEFEAFVKKNVPEAKKQKEFIDYYKGAPAKDRADFFKEVKDAYGKDKDKDDNDFGPAASATLIVHLPAHANLTIDGHRTKSTSGTRTFVTPVLTPGRVFTYQLQATVNVNGENVIMNMTVPVYAGGQMQVRLFPAWDGVTMSK